MAESTNFNDKYFPKVDLSDKERYDFYEYEGRKFAYDKKDALVLLLFKDDEEVEEMGEDKAPYREMDAVGLSRENWDNKDIREEYLWEYCSDLSEEEDELVNSFLADEFSESCDPDKENDDYEPGEDDEDLELITEEKTPESEIYSAAVDYVTDPGMKTYTKLKDIVLKYDEFFSSLGESVEGDEDLELLSEEDPDIKIKKSGLRDYWDKYKSIDPVLKNYNSFDDWAKDSEENGYVYNDDEDLELVDEAVTYGDTARAYDVARYCYDQGMSDRQAVREIQKQLSKEGSIVPAENDIWQIVDGVYEGDTEYVDESKKRKTEDVDFINMENLDNYAEQINSYIQGLPDKPIMWRLYKQNVLLPWMSYRVTDVPNNSAGRLADHLKEMPLLIDKGAKVTITPYDGYWTVNISWKEDSPEEDI